VVLGDKAETLERAIDQIKRLDKWRKQMGKLSHKEIQEQIKTYKDTLEDHLGKAYRNGKDDPETLTFRYKIGYLENLLK
jgi:hypothetical protein